MSSYRRPRRLPIVTPRVSVVGAYYNRADFLEQSVSSVLAQSHEDFEFILVDDGSTDSTQELLSEIRDPRLRFIPQTNLGFLASIRRAISEARGEFIAIHGAGELARPTLLQREVEVLDTDSGIAWVCPLLSSLDPASGHRYTYPAVDSEKMSDHLMGSNTLTHGGSMFRKEIYQSVGGYRAPFTYAMDVDFWLRVSERFRMVQLDEFLYERVYVPRGVSTSRERGSWQALLMSLAIWAAEERRAGRPDPVTVFRESAILLRPSSAWLGRIYAGRALDALGDDPMWSRRLARMSIREGKFTTSALLSTLVSAASHSTVVSGLVLRGTVGLRTRRRELALRPSDAAGIHVPNDPQA